MTVSTHKRGFSLVEVMVSLALMAFLLTVGTQAFVQVKTFTKRMQAKQELHNAARIVYEQLRADVSSMQHTAALWLVSRDGSGGQPKGVELVFLRGKLDHLDFTRQDRFGLADVALTDLVWSRWAWNADQRTLAVSASSRRRSFQLSQSWTNGPINYQNQWFANLPTPRRLAGPIGPQTVLDANAYGTGDLRDIGDYRDLLDNAVPIARPCNSLTVELVLHDGSTVTVDGSSSVIHGFDGVLVDGSVTAAINRRPRLVRVLMDLGDENARLTETFSFTVQAPGMLPP